MANDSTTIKYKQLYDEGEPFYPVVGKSSYNQWLGYEEISGDPPTEGFVTPIENGGTGRTDLADMVIERGTNYMKYASGLMIQWGTHTPASTAMSAMGNIYVSAWITITYPQPFVTFLGGSLCKLDATANTGIYNVSWQTTNVQYTAFRADTNYSGTHSASWVAFGTWK